MGLLEDDAHWEESLKEAAVSESASKMRDLFAIMIVYCQVADPISLWEKYKEYFTEDIFHRQQREFSQFDIQYTEEIYNEGLTLIEDKLLAISGKVLSYFRFLPPKRNIQHNLGNHYLRETMYNTEEQLNFVEENEKKN